MSSKKIVALDEKSHVRLRPTMYVGSVDISDEKLILIKDNLLKSESKKMSVGFYKLLTEILDNGFDALKRDKIPNGKVTLMINSAVNMVTVIDNALGFHEPDQINESTGLTNVETAVSMLRAGSNFYNENTDDNLIGTNGVGSALVNILSDDFSIVTKNHDVIYTHKWKDFVTVSTDIAKNMNSRDTGTTVSFKPLDTIFSGSKWNLEILQSQMCYKKKILKTDPSLKDVEFEFYFDDVKINLDLPFFPEKHFELKTAIGEFVIYPSFTDSASISFINGAQCTGPHQRIIQEWLNEHVFKVSNGHHFYETYINLNLPPKHVRFGDQNKTKYVVARTEIEPILMKHFEKRLKREFIGSEIADTIIDKIEEYGKAAELKKINKKKSESRKKISDKYFAPSKTKGMIFISEGQSACGSLNQKRDATYQGSYALRGKIKNTKRLSDLSSNAEIIDLISILGLDLEKKSGCDYEKIVIATDADEDGSHISSLLINFFYKWFPHVITENRLFILCTPIMSGEVNGRVKYVYSLEDKKDLENARNIRYLKGLGSLNIKDWEKIMKELKVYQIKEDGRSDKILKIAFGDSADSRKKWLSS